MIQDKNLNALKEKYPKLLEIINRTNIDIMLVSTAKSGELTAQINNNYIHSKYDPVKEADKVSENLKKSDLFVLGGFGLGYQCQSIIKHFPNSLIVVYDPSLEIFIDSLKYKDISNIILNKNVIFLTGLSPDYIKDFLIPNKIEKVTYIPLINRVKDDPEPFQKLEEIIRLYNTRIEINKNTLKKFGKLWVKNQSKNLPLLGYKKDISVIFGKFKGISGIIVSAGPSMEILIPYLKKLQKNFLILAVDTAFKSLLEEGIEPDFVMSIDSQYWNARHLEGIKCEKSILIADSSIQPAALREFKNRVFFVHSSYPLGKYFEKSRVNFPVISSGGSVSTNIWDFSKKLGLDKIYFIGQDLGFPGNITHYKNSYFEKNMLRTSNRLNTLETQSFSYIFNGYPTFVTSNNGDKILSDKRMSVYIDWFKEKLSLDSNPNTYTLSPKACAIEGLEYVEIETLTNLPSQRSKIEEILRTLKNREENYYLPNLLESAKNFSNELNNLLQIAENSYKLALAIMENYKSNKNVDLLLKKLTINDQKMIQDNLKDTLSFIIQPYIKEIAESDEKTPLEALEQSIQLYKNIVRTGILHQKYIEHSIYKIATLM
ncbi:MAG: motility associated factor glycosyltransferase family protein [Spirochaetales bacterium]|nr:motility associated factor glycosyltransferase family protein [Spirochaetales bacterium]